MLLRRFLPFLFICFFVFCLERTFAKPFKYLTYSQIYYRLTRLAKAYPSLIRLYSAQDRFSLPYVGNCTEQLTEDGEPKPAPCTIWVVELTNFETLQSDLSRPEVLVSGELHGNEVLGPHAVLAYIEYMTQNYATDSFAKRMVDTRIVTLVPMTNAVGFHQERREETQGHVKYDPNRDFGFDQKSESCMQTVAARALNELFRVHIFRILVTFHGGTNVIGYEWGDTSHCNGNLCKGAPDTGIMRALAERMSNNAGPAGSHEAAYPIGDMGSTVYSVNGGLEDWAYGASWAKEATSCRPATLGGYPADRTRIDRTTKRCVTYLVETARDKKPEEHTLGDDEAILDRGGRGDGHVPRNVRLLFTVVEAAEPYIIVNNEIEKSAAGKPVVSWKIGGAFIVDGTIAQWSTINGTHMGWSDVLNGTAGVTVAGGKSMQFKHELPVNLPLSSVPLYIRIAAVVDRPFVSQPDGCVPDVTPQSHLMGSRGSSRWSFRVGEKRLTGRQVFFSSTMRVTSTKTGMAIGEDQLTAWSEQQNVGKLVTAPDRDLLQAILFHAGRPDQGPIIPTATAVPLQTTILTAVAGCICVVAVAVAIFVFVRRKQRRQKPKNAPSFTMQDFDEETTRALTSSQHEEYEEEEVLSITGMRGREERSVV